MLASPTLEEVFECFADNGFAMGTGDLAEVLQVIEVLLDEHLAHGGFSPLPKVWKSQQNTPFPVRKHPTKGEC